MELVDRGMAGNESDLCSSPETFWLSRCSIGLVSAIEATL